MTTSEPTPSRESRREPSVGPREALLREMQEAINNVGNITVAIRVHNEKISSIGAITDRPEDALSKHILRTSENFNTQAAEAQRVLDTIAPRLAGELREAVDLQEIRYQLEKAVRKLQENLANGQREWRKIRKEADLRKKQKTLQEPGKMKEKVGKDGKQLPAKVDLEQPMAISKGRKEKHKDRLDHIQAIAKDSKQVFENYRKYLQLRRDFEDTSMKEPVKPSAYIQKLLNTLKGPSVLTRAARSFSRGRIRVNKFALSLKYRLLNLSLIPSTPVTEESFLAAKSSALDAKQEYYFQSAQASNSKKFLSIFETGPFTFSAYAKARKKTLKADKEIRRIKGLILLQNMEAQLQSERSHKADIKDAIDQLSRLQGDYKKLARKNFIASDSDREELERKLARIKELGRPERPRFDMPRLELRPDRETTTESRRLELADSDEDLIARFFQDDEDNGEGEPAASSLEDSSVSFHLEDSSDDFDSEDFLPGLLRAIEDEDTGEEPPEPKPEEESDPMGIVGRWSEFREGMTKLSNACYDYLRARGIDPDKTDQEMLSRRIFAFGDSALNEEQQKKDFEAVNIELHRIVDAYEKSYKFDIERVKNSVNNFKSALQGRDKEPKTVGLQELDAAYEKLANPPDKAFDADKQKVVILNMTAMLFHQGDTTDSAAKQAFDAIAVSLGMTKTVSSAVSRALQTSPMTLDLEEKIQSLSLDENSELYKLLQEIYSSPKLKKTKLENLESKIDALVEKAKTRPINVEQLRATLNAFDASMKGFFSRNPDKDHADNIKTITEALEKFKAKKGRKADAENIMYSAIRMFNNQAKGKPEKISTRNLTAVSYKRLQELAATLKLGDVLKEYVTPDAKAEPAKVEKKEPYQIRLKDAKDARNRLLEGVSLHLGIGPTRFSSRHEDNLNELYLAFKKFENNTGTIEDSHDIIDSAIRIFNDHRKPRASKSNIGAGAIDTDSFKALYDLAVSLNTLDILKSHLKKDANELLESLTSGKSSSTGSAPPEPPPAPPKEPTPPPAKEKPEPAKKPKPTKETKPESPDPKPKKEKAPEPEPKPEPPEPKQREKTEEETAIEQKAFNFRGKIKKMTSKLKEALEKFMENNDAESLKKDDLAEQATSIFNQAVQKAPNKEAATPRAYDALREYHSALGVDHQNFLPASLDSSQESTAPESSEQLLKKWAQERDALLAEVKDMKTADANILITEIHEAFTTNETNLKEKASDQKDVNTIKKAWEIQQEKLHKKIFTRQVTFRADKAKRDADIKLDKLNLTKEESQPLSAIDNALARQIDVLKTIFGTWESSKDRLHNSLNTAIDSYNKKIDDFIGKLPSPEEREFQKNWAELTKKFVTPWKRLHGKLTMEYGSDKMYQLFMTNLSARYADVSADLSAMEIVRSTLTGKSKITPKEAGQLLLKNAEIYFKATYGGAAGDEPDFSKPGGKEFGMLKRALEKIE